ncbi:GNAT family N-acetyltransferase [Herbaspirillum sp. SJZ107]|uniref:GNAT family N-acetyltransferase n=1 Tax=Herbaspirillum sp. SJZ107 TaxID=2572881 RepID=UPI0011529C6E|nr:GNAT family N-acetyltransferase [Herbaspirillum sp. SJZ107]TQK07684.1 ribosomal protein S18 acetylase RimI-like enzyme [Herbaspirillum sp. SJZ107]
MTIREAGPGDFERIAALFGQLGYPNDAGQLARRLAALPAGDTIRVLVAQEGDTVAGVAVVHVMAPLHVPDRWALLSALVVDDGQRSGGIGAALLQAAEAFAREHGCAHLELSSNVARTRAHRFYERQGYREKRMRFVKMLVP